MKVEITEVQQKAKLQTKIGLRKRRCGSCKGKTFEKEHRALREYLIQATHLRRIEVQQKAETSNKHKMTHRVRTRG